MLKQKRFYRHEFKSFYDYIQTNEYIVDRYTTTASLSRMHDELVSANFKIPVKSLQFFPSPWFDSEWEHNQYRIKYISNHAELKELSFKQENCVISYAPKIVFDGVQIYSLVKEEKIIGTIEVISNQGDVTLGQYAGYRNKKLAKEQIKLIKQ